MPTVQFDLLWRKAGAADAPIVSFTHQYPDTNAAQYDETKSAAAVAAVKDDLIVLKVSVPAAGNDPNAAYIPIGEHEPTPTARFLSVDIP